MSDLVIGAIGGAVITSLLAPYLNQAPTRRKVRAEVLEAISATEKHRWASSEADSFREAIKNLRTRAMIARLNREVTEYYIFLASVCRFNSQRDFDDNDAPDEFKGSIPTDLSDLAREAADVLVVCLWHPIRSKPFRTKKLDDLQRRVKNFERRNINFTKGTKEPPVYWDVKY